MRLVRDRVNKLDAIKRDWPNWMRNYCNRYQTADYRPTAKAARRVQNRQYRLARP